MNQHSNLQNSIKLMQEHAAALQREFGHIFTGKNIIADTVSYPAYPEETEKVRDGIKAVLEGSMLIYLLAMWESHVPKDVHEWLTSDEKGKLNAFKHVRDCAAHKYAGGRAKDHNSKVRAFEREMPFSNIVWSKEADTIDLSNSNVSYEFYQFMEGLAKNLVVRFHTNKKPVT